MWALGLSDGHLQDAMAEIALSLLASGTSLAYGGDLRANGFTRLLFDLVGRYRDHPRHDGTISVTNYLAWPVHIRMNADELCTFADEHRIAAELLLLAEDGKRLSWEKRSRVPAREPEENEWTHGLTAMRTVMREETGARVVLGGRVEGYKGTMPGIAEETCLSLQAQQPVYLLGGFGGCARDITETITLVEQWQGSRGHWPGRHHFRQYSPDDLRNGLTREENIMLARTPHIREAIGLVSQGLRRVMNHRN